MKPTRTRNRKWLAIGGLGLISVLVALGLLSGTLARYTYKETLTDSARVAVFDVGVGDGSRDFRLFETILDSNGGAEDDVAKAGAGEAAIIAPGTRGSFELALYNKSEVTVGYAVSIEVDNDGIPLQFSTDGSSWTDDLDTALTSGTLPMQTGTESVTVHWQWPFEVDRAGDIADTALGEAAQDADIEVIATASVLFDQLD